MTTSFCACDTRETHPASECVPSWQSRDETFVEDIRAVAVALGLGGHARPYSAHAVVHREILPAVQRVREDVLSIHYPTQVWTDSEIDEDGERQTALYDDNDELVYAPDVRTVCSGCDIRNEVPWPCPTARAVGADE